MKKTASRKKTSTAAPAPKRGRPATGRQRTDQVVVRFTPEERHSIEAAAAAVEMPLTVWLRELALKAAR